MISFTLKCDNGHRFDSWFQSASAFDTLKGAGHLTCPECGSAQVEKAIMAPAVSPARAKGDAAPAAPAAPVASNQPASNQPPVEMPAEVREAIQKMKAHVESTSDYVGKDFAKQARDMHLGDIPEKPIYGEVAAPEAKALIDDGVPVMPLPFTPTKKAN